MSGLSDKHIALKDVKLISYKKKQKSFTYDSNLLKDKLYLYHLFIKYMYFICMHTNVKHVTLTKNTQIYVSNALCRHLTLKLSYKFQKKNYCGCLLCGSKLCINHELDIELSLLIRGKTISIHDSD